MKKYNKKTDIIAYPMVIKIRLPLGWSKEYRAGWDMALSVLRQIDLKMMELTWQMDRKRKAKKK